MSCSSSFKALFLGNAPMPPPTYPTTIGGQLNLATAFVAAQTPTQAVQHVNVMRDMVGAFGIPVGIPHYPDATDVDTFMTVHRETVAGLRPHLQARFMQALNEYVRRPPDEQLKHFAHQQFDRVNFGAMRAAGLLTEDAVGTFSAGIKTAMEKIAADTLERISFYRKGKIGLGIFAATLASAFLYVITQVPNSDGVALTLMGIFTLMFAGLANDYRTDQERSRADGAQASALIESASSW